jgi:hypothetical protein
VELGWESETLDIALAKIVKELKPKAVRVLVGDKLCYVLRLKVPSTLDKEEERSFIAKEISAKIPEVLADMDWDYKDLHFNVAQEKKTQEGEKEVVVFSPVKGFFAKLSRAVNKLGIVVEAIEPEAIAKTRNENPLVGLARKADIKGEDRNVLNIEPLEISAPEEEEVDELKSNELLTNEAKKLKAKSEKIEKEKDIEVVEKKVKVEIPSDKKGNKRELVLRLFLALIFLSSIGYIIYYFSPSILRLRKQDVEIAQEDVISQPDKPEPTETPNNVPVEELDLSIYKIQLQNGTGIAGEATFVSDILLAEGFENIDTSDADSFDYVVTQINIKPDVSKDIYRVFERSLNSDFKVVDIPGQLNADSEYDVIVIIGNRSE